MRLTEPVASFSRTTCTVTKIIIAAVNIKISSVVNHTIGKIAINKKGLLKNL